MKFRGYTRDTGLMAVPLMSRCSTGKISPRPSMGRPEPSKIRPRSSGDRGISTGWPSRRVRVLSRAMPLVPSNTWITTRSPSIWTIRPARSVPLSRRMETVSSKVASLTPSRAMREPLISLTPMYSMIIWSVPLLSFERGQRVVDFLVIAVQQLQMVVGDVVFDAADLVE